MKRVRNEDFANVRFRLKTSFVVAELSRTSMKDEIEHLRDTQ